MRVRLILVILILILALCGCDRYGFTIAFNTSSNDDPEYLYSENNEIDMIVYAGTAYVNASDVAWVEELELTIGDEIGEIEADYKPNIKADLSATKLEIGTLVHKVIENSDILIVEIENELVRYLAWIEG